MRERKRENVKHSSRTIGTELIVTVLHKSLGELELITFKVVHLPGKDFFGNYLQTSLL